MKRVNNHKTISSKQKKNHNATTMTGRGTGKRRGRPPKTQTLDRQSAKYNYNSMRKPKYVTDSQFSTPSASRASSPQGSDHSSRRGRPSTSRKSVSTRGRGRKRGSGHHNSRKSKCLNI